MTLITILMTLAIQAQSGAETNPVNKEVQEIQTILSDPGPLGWWVSPDFAWTKIDGKDAFLGGISGGIIINHSFSVGLAGYGIMNSQNLKYRGINDTADVYLYGGYGGIKLEYRLNPSKKINLAFPLLIGAGGAAYSTYGHDDWHNYDGDEDYAYACLGQFFRD